MSDTTPATADFNVGDILVTSLADGVLRESTAVLHGIDGDAAAALLPAASLVITINAFLVRTADMLVLIDSGAGDSMGPDAGRLVSSLATAGVASDDVELILLTHMPPDATVFLNPAIAESVPDAVKPVFAKARAVQAAYAGRFDTFDGSAELAPGITPVALPGHSPGHTGFRIADGGYSLLIWGDVVHVPAIQFGHPDVGMIFDADAPLAERTRRDAFAAAAASGEPIAGMHLHHPGFAKVVAEGTGYRFEPSA
jgi:glyoxylase-like metal-dependent hydrolase (beta-lactamase superfamily II)